MLQPPNRGLMTRWRGGVLWLVLLLALATALSNSSLAAQGKHRILTRLERLAASEEYASDGLAETVRSQIKKEPKAAVSLLVPKLKEPAATERQLAVYVWALGLAENPAAAEPIIELHRQSKSDLVRGNCLRALAFVGGEKAQDFLLSVLDATVEKEMRFDILNLLGQMQCEAALPAAGEVLKQDYPKFYWQPIFVFGKMGDKGLPFLLKRIDDPERNVRAHAINVVGHWLIEPAAAEPLLERFWKEEDPELRVMILGSLEKAISDLGEQQRVFEQVVAKENHTNVVRFARETLAHLSRVKGQMAALAKKRRASAAAFNREYTKLYESAGHKGEYEALAAASTAADEPKLKALRERILQRNSDEAFYDYQKVNNIIMQNRLIKNAAERKTAGAAWTRWGIMPGVPGGFTWEWSLIPDGWRQGCWAEPAEGGAGQSAGRH
jgi:HEAT repeat protein